MNTTPVKRPRVTGLVGLSIVEGLLSIYSGVVAIQALNEAGITINLTGQVLVYGIILLGVVGIVAGVLILTYKRLWLIRAAVAFGLGLALQVLGIVSRWFQLHSSSTDSG